jgi:TolA-binding protein
LPVRARAYAGIARALKAQGDLPGAAKHFLSVAVLFDDAVLAPECLYEAAEAFRLSGRKADAAKVTDELLERYPQSDWAKKSRAADAQPR